MRPRERNREPLPYLIERWDSLTACVEAAIKRPHWGGGTWGEDRHFQGGTFEEAKRWALGGWPEGARLATDKSQRIVERVLNSQTALQLTTELQYDVVGGAYDVGAICSGTPEAWLRPEPQLVKRAISVVLNCCASAGVSATTIERRGLAVASLVLSLQAKGYPVTVDVAQVATYSSGVGDTYCKVVRVIDASTGSQIDVDRLVYAIAHPTMFRCVFQAATGDGWGSSSPESDGFPPGEYDLKIGGSHLYEAERWQDGGEAWVLAEFERQSGL